MKNLNRIAYIILAVLVGVMVIAAAIASFAGDNSIFAGDGTLASAWFPITLLGIYALVQIGCLALYHFGFNVYKIGFALLHVGILVMLVGFLAGAIGGEKYVQVFAVGENLDYLIKEDGSDIYRPGYYVGVTNFTLERYEPSENGVQSDKYYRADLLFMEPSGETESAYLEMNKTFRKEGLKYYLMSYGEGQISGGYPLFNLDALQKTYEGTGYDDLCRQIDADYPDQTFTVHYYNKATGAYTDSWMTYMSYESCPGYAYVTEEGDGLHLYIYPKQVVLLIKRDPGEYAVLAGMVLVMAGTVMTCLLRRKKRSAIPTEGEVSGS